MTIKRGRRGGNAQAVKIVVTGPFAAGKTTLIRTISEITVLSTEKDITDQTKSRKAETTVAMDFGRITVDDSLVMYLFGTPGQERFAFMWDDLCDGALGAVVLADTRRLADSFVALDYFETRNIPMVVGVNHFAGSYRYPIPEVREALGVAPEIPVVDCDARNRESVKVALVTLLQHVYELRRAALVT